jgi:hypothetical protein
MSSDNQIQKNQTSPYLPVFGIIGGLVGYYCGMTLLIPAIGGYIAFLLARRFVSAAVQPFATTLAIHFGHWLRMLTGGIWGADGMAPYVIDLALIVFCLTWLVALPSLVPVVLLCIYQGFSLAVNVIAIIGQEFGSNTHEALTANIVLRLFALATLLLGYSQFRKNQGDAASNAT